MRRDDLVAVLRPLLAGDGLKLAALFGSAARDALRPDSDVDIGIVPTDPAMSLRDELRLQAALERATGRTVDLVRLDRASILLRWRAAREGVVLVADPPRDWPRFLARAALEHADFQPLYARAAERFRRRVASGVKSG